MTDDRAARIAEIRAVASSKMLRDALAEIDRLTAERDAALAREAALLDALDVLMKVDTEVWFARPYGPSEMAGVIRREALRQVVQQAKDALVASDRPGQAGGQ